MTSVVYSGTYRYLQELDFVTLCDVISLSFN